MTRQEGLLLFHSMHPDFFKQESIRNLPDEWFHDEMVLALDKFEPCRYDKKLDDNISFGYYQSEKVISLGDKIVSLGDNGISLSDKIMPLCSQESSQREEKIPLGDMSEIIKAVERVEQNWTQYYSEKQRIYCGYIDGKIASFCLIENMGVHNLNGRKVKVGGPGCVGTLPEYRNRGIGLTMVKHVTQILKEEGYDYSYIHYTGVASWYAKLGYQTSIRWTGKGILE